MAFPTRIYGKYGWEKVVTTSKKHPFGTIMEFRDGRLFRYAQANGAILAGRLASSRPISNAAHDGDLVLAAAVAIGGTTVTLTNASAAVVVDQFNDGLLFVNDDGTSNPAGEGTLYRVKTSSVATTTGTITIVIDEEEGIQSEALLTADSQLGLIENEWAEANLWDVDAIDGIPTGWAQVNVADNEFLWLCTHGPTMALYDSDDNSVRGFGVIPSPTGGVDGSVRGFDLGGTTAVQNMIIGRAMVVSVDTELQPVFALID